MSSLGSYLIVMHVCALQNVWSLIKEIYFKVITFFCFFILSWEYFCELCLSVYLEFKTLRNLHYRLRISKLIVNGHNKHASSIHWLTLWLTAGQPQATLSNSNLQFCAPGLSAPCFQTATWIRGRTGEWLRGKRSLNYFPVGAPCTWQIGPELPK